MFYQIRHKLYELKLLLKTNSLYYMLSMIILLLFLSIAGIVLTIHMNANVQERYISEVYDGKKFYDVKDSLYDPTQFYDYRHKEENIDKIADFYNALNNSSAFDFLSVFTQFIPIKNFKGDSSFNYNSEAFRTAHPSESTNIKSVQLNQNAFDFYKIEVNIGESISWNDINYNSGEIPVLLGSNYKGLYEIGDIINGKYYLREMEMVVKGFVKENTFISYNGTPEFYLDHYLILPYPPTCEPVDKNDYEFEGILYFAMINGRIASSLPKEDLIYEIKLIADTTHFIEFSIVGLSELNLKYSELLSVIKENQKLLLMSIIFLLILITLVQYGIARIIFLKRENVYKNYWLIGYSPYKRLYMRDISIPYLGAYILANLLLFFCLKKLSIAILLFTAAISFGILIIIFFSCSNFFESKMSDSM